MKQIELGCPPRPPRPPILIRMEAKPRRGSFKYYIPSIAASYFCGVVPENATCQHCQLLPFLFLQFYFFITFLPSGVSGKIVFFLTIHCNPSLAYLAVRDLQSSQRNVSKQSLLLAGNFLYKQQQPSAGEGEVANFREFLRKTQYLMSTLQLEENKKRI